MQWVVCSALASFNTVSALIIIREYAILAEIQIFYTLHKK